MKGMGTPVIIAIVAVLLVLAGTAYYNLRPEGEIMMDKGEKLMEEGESMKEEGEKMMEEGEQMMKEGEKMIEGDATAEGAMTYEGYQGTLLAGSEEVPLLDFNKADYDKAVAEGKLVALFFYANWCPTCKVEFPKMESAFDKLDVKNVVGFRVNYNDNQTDNDEEQLARKFGVAYQHTKVFVQNGERVLKSPEGWDEARYINEITQRAQ